MNDYTSSMTSKFESQVSQILDGIEQLNETNLEIRNEIRNDIALVIDGIEQVKYEFTKFDTNFQSSFTQRTHNSRNNYSRRDSNQSLLNGYSGDIGVTDINVETQQELLNRLRRKKLKKQNQFKQEKFKESFLTNFIDDQSNLDFEPFDPSVKLEAPLRKSTQKIFKDVPNNVLNGVIITNSSGNEINLNNLRRSGISSQAIPNPSIKAKKELHYGGVDEIVISGNKFKCQLCPKQFGAFLALEKHIENHGGQKIEKPEERTIAKEIPLDFPDLDISISKNDPFQGWKKEVVEPPTQINDDPAFNQENVDSIDKNVTQQTVKSSEIKLPLPPSFIKEKASTEPSNENLEPLPMELTFAASKAAQAFAQLPVLPPGCTRKPKLRKDAVITCKNCTYRTREEHEFEEHVKTVCPQQVPTCHYCFNVFEDKPSRHAHIEKEHSAPRTLVCDHCAYVTNKPSGLEKHIKWKHLKILDYQCDQCTRKCPSAAVLKNHIKRVHLGLKEYQCPECDQFYSRRDNMNMHIRQVHWGVKEHVCPYCPYAVNRRSTLHEHIIKEHGEYAGSDPSQFEVSANSFATLPLTEKRKLYKNYHLQRAQGKEQENPLQYLNQPVLPLQTDNVVAENTSVVGENEQMPENSEHFENSMQNGMTENEFMPINEEQLERYIET